MSDERITIPAGHEVRVVDLPTGPGVARSHAGAIIASLGTASDAADRELADVVAGVERELAAPKRTIDLVAQTGRVEMRDLFAPSRPSTARIAAPVEWCFHAGAVASMMATAERRAVLFTCMRRIARTDVMQLAAVIGDATPAVLAFAEVAHGLGIQIRSPDTSQRGLAVAIEVKRPDDLELCVIAGLPFAGLAARPDADRALCAIDDAAFAARLAALAAVEPEIVYRSPRLREIAIAGDHESLFGALLRRTAPVFTMRNLPAKSPEIRRMGGEGVVPIYVDVTAVQWAAADLGKPDGSYELGPLAFTSALRAAASDQLGLGVGLYRDRKTPMYVVMPAALVAAMARELP